MTTVADIINEFVKNRMTKGKAEELISRALGGKWVLSIVNNEWVPVQFKD